MTRIPEKVVKKTSRSQEAIRKVAEHVGQTPKVSVRRLALRVGLSKSSTHRILKKDLNLSAFKFKYLKSCLLRTLSKEKNFANGFCNSASTAQDSCLVFGGLMRLIFI